MKPTIIIRYDDDSLFGNESTDGLDTAACVDKFAELATAAVKAAYPDADIEVEYGPTLKEDEYRDSDYTEDDDESQRVREITRQVYEDMEWVVYRQEA